ncbi:Histone transcription regulator 3 [Coemansia biformis]|uniref:Histone transcription regulator 3 n=1 Tax=Coemansia biformis TaxID=1286918 RepID=A0A9W7YBP0_9FUNG|nr:Histone transcription regulator 3 [Coemansia biformis]
MPVFTSINPPPDPRAEAGGNAEQAAPTARIEEEVRELIQGYQAALCQWQKGLCKEAYAGFARLAERELLSHSQERHIESECNAYCQEYGGVSISRLRALVLANVGLVQLAVEAGGQRRWPLGGLDFDGRGLLGTDADRCEEAAVGAALARLTAALAFDQANTAHRLVAGQCAMALGHYDVAVSVLGSAAHAERRRGPLTWWCVRAAVQAALMRGDVDLATGIVEGASRWSRSASKELLELLAGLVVVPARSCAPAVLRLPFPAAVHVPSAAAAASAADPPPALAVRASGNAVSIAALGEELVAYYRQCAAGTLGVGAAGILRSVPLEVSAEAAEDPAAAAQDGEALAADTGVPAKSDDSDADAGQGDCHPEPAAECLSHTDLDDAGSGLDCPAGHSTFGAAKRHASSSGDEMPAKRRSTRQARDAALDWLSAIGAATGQTSTTTFSRCAALAEAASRQLRPGQKHKYQRHTQSTPNSSTLADWNLATHSRGSKPPGADALLATIQSTASLSAKYSSSLTAHLGWQHCGLGESTLATVGSPPLLSLSVPECRALFDGNSGVFDLLLRYINVVLEAFYAAPLAFLESARLKLAVLAAVQVVHEMLLDWAKRGLSADGSADDLRQGIRCGTLIILLLADSSARGAPCQQLNSSMRADWVSAVDDAIGRLGHRDSDPCISQYRIAKSWTDYEAAVASNNIRQAAASAARCMRALQRCSGNPESALVARCSLSAEPVTLEVVKQRRAHLEFFSQLGTAAELARTNERRAIALLNTFAEPFAKDVAASLAFPQQVAAARLLAVLCRRQAMQAEEARAVLYELHLYLSRLLVRPADAAQPSRLALVRCVECLQAVSSMAAAGPSVDQYLESPESRAPMLRLVGQLVPMALALANHFEANPPAMERPATSPEATFVGLALWLVSWLAAQPALGIPAQSPTSSPADPASPSAASDCKDQPGDGSQSPATRSECSDDAGALGSHARFFSDVHSLLGERGLCTAADGALLKHVLLECRKRLDRDSDSLAHWRVAGSCLRCLFDIKLHNSGAERHPSAHVEMNHQSADAAYLLVESELLDTLRSRKGAGLRSDLKAVVDKAGGALASIDIAEHPRLSMNMDAIDDYLDGATMPTFTQLEQALYSDDNSCALRVCCIPLRDAGGDADIPAACLSLPFVRATMQHDLLLSRMRSGLTRAIEEYDEIIEDYQLNVSLHPASAEAWYHLGQAHSDLADELLLGTASEILERKHDIATLLRSALSCALQAKQLLAPPSAPASAGPYRRHGTRDGSGGGCGSSRLGDGNGDGGGDGDSSTSGGDSDSSDANSDQALRRLHVHVYSFVGRLLYRIAARPFPMLALEILPSNMLAADDAQEGEQTWDVGTWGPNSERANTLSQSLARRYCTPPPRRRVYALAHEMLLRASRLEPGNWRWAYMLGKVVGKLNSSPLAACALYLKAFHLAAAPAPSPPSAGSLPEGAVEALYKLLSLLTKLVGSQQADGATAQRFLDALPFSTAGASVAAAAAGGSGQPEDGLPAAPGPGIAPPLVAIRSILEQVCASDKRRWHHRAAFLLAWMDHRVFADPERAKHTLLGLVQTRSAGKQLASFYKTEFEAPGKHYLYLEKYLRLYIATLVATLDVSAIHALARKLQRTSDMLYDAPDMLRRASTAELAILQGMVRGLNCPRLAADGAGKNQVVMQASLDPGNATKARAMFRHCRLNRTQFNYARDFARENIALLTSVHQRIRAALAAAEAAPPEAAALPPGAAPLKDELARVDREVAGYLDTANKAVVLFGHLLDHKKHADDPELLSQLNDGIADVYVLVLSAYGQSRCVAHAPHPHEHAAGTPADICRQATELLAQAPRPAQPGDPFWQCVIFDEARHDSSQQYRLLDPLLEFQVNKLLDSVRDAQTRPGGSQAVSAGGLPGPNSGAGQDTQAASAAGADRPHAAQELVVDRIS